MIQVNMGFHLRIVTINIYLQLNAQYYQVRIYFTMSQVDLHFEMTVTDLIFIV